MHGELLRRTTAATRATLSRWTSEVVTAPTPPARPMRRVFPFGAGNQQTVGLVPCDRKLVGINAGGAVSSQVSTAVSMKYRICRGAVTAAVTAKQHFWSFRKLQFPATGFQGVSTESGIFWTGYQCWLPSWLTRKPRFSDWYARRRYATGTHGKAAFAGAENLSKPYLQNLKKPETQDAAKPYIRWCTRA